MSKTKIAAVVAGVAGIALVVFAGVQTYRVHELAGRVGVSKVSVSASDSRPHPESVPAAPPPVKKIEESPAPDKPGGTGDADAAKYSEAVLKGQRARVKTTTGGGAASAAQGPEGADALARAATAASTAVAAKSGTDAAAKKTDQDAASKDARAIAAQTQGVLNSVQGLVEKGSYDDAIAMLKQGTQADPTSRDLYRTLGGLYHRLGQYDAELQTYADWSANAPGESFPHYDQARTYAALGKSAESLQELGQFLNMTKGDMNAYPMVASVYRQLGMSAEEGTALQMWEQQAPDAVDVKRILADYYARTGDTQASLAEYQGIVQRLPEDADAHRSLAFAYRRMNMNAEAETELATAVDLQPRNMFSRVQLGDVYRQNREFDAAIQMYNSVIAEAPNTPEGQQAQQAINQIQQQIQQAAPQPK